MRAPHTRARSGCPTADSDGRKIADREDGTSMIGPIEGEAPSGAPRSQGVGRTDLAMNVLQYGTALVAIVVVTLLAVVR